MNQSNSDGIDEIDADGFTAEIGQLRKETLENLSAADYRHLRKIERWGRLSTILGYATAWIFPNPLSAILLANALMTRWLLMHHIGHGGYDRVPGIPDRYTSKRFAMGWRRFIDWFDWIEPAAWNYEHNYLHHYHTGEETDPDLAERNLKILRELRIPTFLKYFVLLMIAITWKFTYYAPNTINGLQTKRDNKGHGTPQNSINTRNFLNPLNPLVQRLWLRCYLPYFIFNFVLIPGLFLAISIEAACFVLANRLVAEFLTNLHTFMVIVPNHAGDDLYRFTDHFRNKQEFYINQVIGSVNYDCGTEWLDYSQMWLNYQIEHHLMPDLPMSTYREIQPKVKALCARYGVPYIQENLFKRCRKLVDISVGDATMRVKKVSGTF